MSIDKNKVVTLSYHLSSSFDNQPEELVEQTTSDRPFVFLFGAGNLIPEFEMNLKGKNTGDKFDFKISAPNAYGLHDKEYVVNIPKEAFHVEGKFDDERVVAGAELPMLDADGNQMYGLVLEVADTHVIMDFNHPLAGHDLHFVGEVMEVRDANEEEIAHGHVHGPGGHHH